MESTVVDLIVFLIKELRQCFLEGHGSDQCDTEENLIDLSSVTLSLIPLALNKISVNKRTLAAVLQNMMTE